MFERFAGSARDTVTAAVLQAQDLGSGRVGPEHLLLAMCGPGGFLTRQGYAYADVRDVIGAFGRADEHDDAEALSAIGIDLTEVKRALAASFGDAAWTQSAGAAKHRLFGKRVRTPFDPAARKALELALREAIAMAQRTITVEHLVLGITRDPTPLVAQVVQTHGSVEELRRAARQSLHDAA